MGRRRRLSLPFRMEALDLDDRELDANDRFVLRNCAAWLERVLARFPGLGQTTLEFALWVLGPVDDSGTLRRFRRFFRPADRPRTLDGLPHGRTARLNQNPINLCSVPTAS